jgi:transketolase
MPVFAKIAGFTSFELVNMSATTGPASETVCSVANTAIPVSPLANAIRFLSMDAVQKAASGHPGAPMGMAEIAEALWNRHLKHNPTDPQWMNRDRFVLSNGHGSMLLYSLLHLTGYDLTIDDLKAFRQLHSKTPGHPEVDITPGVETTTGPLGQGISNGVGMALAEKILAAQFNKPGFGVVDHFTYVFTGDGCLMEGVSHEVCSFAGTLKLSKLIVLWDDNGISIDGAVRNWFSEDVVKRYQAYGWNVIADVDGHDVMAVDTAIAKAKQWAIEGCNGVFAPTFIQCKTLIGKGAPSKQGSSKTHGEPLGLEEIAAARLALGWPYAPFEVPADIYAAWDAKVSGSQKQAVWEELFDAYEEQFPKDAEELERRMAGELPADFRELGQQMLADALTKAETIATRKASQNSLNHLGPNVPEMIGGSADLTGSNLTNWAGVVSLRAGQGNDFTAGRHINFGVREFGMSAIANGMALHGGFIPFVGTFLTFSDYARNAIRMAALMRKRVIYVYTHDSIGLGEDGPTHQSVEHTASLRLIPNLDVWRPCDTVETAVAWKASVERATGPSALMLTRQNCAFVVREPDAIDSIKRGGYVLSDTYDQKQRVVKPQIALIATGSEVGLAIQAAQTLKDRGIAVRVVSIPCTSQFDRQDVTYKRSVLPDNLPRVAIEAGVTDGWWKYRCDAVMGIDRFGESAPAPKVFEALGLTADKLVQTALTVLGKKL